MPKRPRSFPRVHQRRRRFDGWGGHWASLSGRSSPGIERHGRHKAISPALVSCACVCVVAYWPGGPGGPAKLLSPPNHTCIASILPWPFAPPWSRRVFLSALLDSVGALSLCAHQENGWTDRQVALSAITCSFCIPAYADSRSARIKKTGGQTGSKSTHKQ